MNGILSRLAVVSVAFCLLGSGCVTTPPPQSVTSSRSSASSNRPKPVLCVGTRESTRRQREVAQAAARRLGGGGRRVARHRHASRYFAVKTESTTDTTGAASCMVFDRQSGNLVNNLVFDCDRIPQVGEMVKFTTYNATYVGG